MERLTKKSDSGMIWFIDYEHKNPIDKEPCEMDYRNNRLAIEKLAEYEDLEEQGKLLKLPCALGDFALFSDKRILPVTFISKTNEGIIVGCQNGIRISMDSQYGDWCKGFYRSREEAEEKLKEL